MLTNYTAKPIKCLQALPVLGKLNLFYKCTKQVTIATESREELVVVQCQSFIFMLELPRANWAWDLMTDTFILASADKGIDKTVEQKTPGVGRGGRLTLVGEADCH